LVAFAKALRQRLAQIPCHKRNEPLTRSLAHMSYYNSCIPNLRKHTAHVDSGYVMYSTGAIFEVLWSADEEER
jgi:hypothetical protein